jgi:hypothetical protein
MAEREGIKDHDFMLFSYDGEGDNRYIQLYGVEKIGGMYCQVNFSED